MSSTGRAVVNWRTALDARGPDVVTAVTAAAPMNAASKCLALHQDMALVQMYGKDELFSLPAWKVLSAPPFNKS